MVAGQRKGILWNGVRAWSDDVGRNSDFVREDRNAGLAFLPQVCGDQGWLQGRPLRHSI